MVLETAGEVGETALAIVTSIRHLADVVEHVSAGEEQDKNQADGGPQVAVLDDGKDVGRSDCEEGEDTNDSGCDSDDLDIVDRTLDRWVRRVGKVTAQPRVDRISLVGTDAIGMLVLKDRIDAGTSTHPERKSKRVGEGSVFALGPVVGWNRSKTGAVCNCSWIMLATATVSCIHHDNPPIGKRPCHPKSPVFQTTVFPLLPCRPCSSCALEGRTRAGNRCRDHS